MKTQFAPSRFSLLAVFLSAFEGIALFAHPHLMDGAQTKQGRALGRPAPDRALGSTGLAELVRLSDVLMDKRRDWVQREFAARSLGLEVAHRACIPALVAVLRDKGDHPTVRQTCVKALSWIRDPRVLDFLMEALLDEDLNVRTEGAIRLRSLTRNSFDETGHLQRSSQRTDWKELQRQWTEWWDKNRHDVTIQWDNALVER